MGLPSSHANRDNSRYGFADPQICSMVMSCWWADRHYGVAELFKFVLLKFQLIGQTSYSNRGYVVLSFQPFKTEEGVQSLVGIPSAHFLSRLMYIGSWMFCLESFLALSVESCYSCYW